MNSSKPAIVVCCFLMVSAGPFDYVDRFKDGLVSRIVNGTDAAHEFYPFLVSIEVYVGYMTMSGWSSTCGGSIVNRETVLTACHCVTSDEKIHGNVKYMAKPESLRVVAGTAYWDRNTPTKQVRKARRLVTHPKCKNFFEMDMSYVNDVALVFLMGPLDYSYQVKPLPLPSMNIPQALMFLKRLVREGVSCTTVGWGRTVESESEQSQILQSTVVQLLPPKECRSRFCDMIYDHCETDFERHGQLCVVSPTSSDCFGDSGGPLICNGFVVGTVSYGNRCLPNLPTVYQGLRPILEVLAINHVRIDDAEDLRAHSPFAYGLGPSNLHRYNFGIYNFGKPPTTLGQIGIGNPYQSVLPELRKINQIFQTPVVKARAKGSLKI